MRKRFNIMMDSGLRGEFRIYPIPFSRIIERALIEYKKKLKEVRL